MLRNVSMLIFALLALSFVTLHTAIADTPPPTLQIEGQSTLDVTHAALDIDFYASEGGLLHIERTCYETQETEPVAAVPVQGGMAQLRWSGLIDGVPTAPGTYSLALTLEAANGEKAARQQVFFHMRSNTPDQPSSQGDVPEVQVLATDAPVPQSRGWWLDSAVSRPYSAYEDNTFWSMSPGETDDSAIWKMMTQPIIVFDNGSAQAISHAYLMENPDGTGERVAQLHALSQGVHVVGSVNAHGYVLVEAFSNYDLDYQPRTGEEYSRAFELKRGYIRAEHLRRIDVNQGMAFLVDKLTQRMYVFLNGERVTELAISTGKATSETLYRETIAGEFITISKTGGYWSNDYYSDFAIRINGGTLIHEVPYVLDADGAKSYRVSEPFLGSKYSAGCIRVQRKANADGYNMRWLWQNIQNGERYKVLVWDDVGRVDTPRVWY